VNIPQITVIEATKRIIYDGFKAAIAAGLPKESACMLVDDQYGQTVLLDATTNGYTVAYPLEKPGQDELEFEHQDYGKRIEGFQPAFCKVSVQYNPERGRNFNQVQITRLAELAQYLRSRSQSRLMVELLVPPEDAQIRKANEDFRAYEAEIRPALVVRAIKELHDADIRPDVWMLEGVEGREDCEKIAAAARSGGSDPVGCIVAGRGEDDERIRGWLTVAAPVSGFIGFSLGHDFWEPLWRWRAKTETREFAVADIARRYREFADFYEHARG